MEWRATRVYILTFDTHIFLDPFWGTKIFNDSVGFLNGFDSYSKFLADASPDPSRNFIFTPVTALKKNSFWKKIAPVFSKLGYQKFLPVHVTVPSGQVQLNAKAVSGCSVGTVEQSYFLWDWGWSSLVDIDIAGGLDRAALISLSNMLTSRNQNNDLFVIGNNPVKLSSVYKSMQQELYNHALLQTPQQENPLKNNFVMTIVSTEAEGPTDINSLSTDDKAAVFSILMGRGIEESEFAQIDESTYKFIPLKGGIDYAVLKYEKGSLLMMADSRSKKIENDSDIRCYSANVRAYTAMMYMLQIFLNVSQKYISTQYQDPVKSALGIIPSLYNSIYTNAFYSDNSFLTSPPRLLRIEAGPASAQRGRGRQVLDQ